MLDNLKDHIESKRDDFEIYPFDTDWDTISQKLVNGKKWPVWKMASIAACFLLVVMGSIHQMRPVNEVNNELAEMEQYYANEISEKILLVTNQLEDNSILKDLEVMDQAFADLKADLKDNVDNEEVIEAMMENYRLKLKILDEILSELAKDKRENIL